MEDLLKPTEEDFLKQSEDAQKFEFQILIEEYKTIRAEIQQRVGFHGQITTVGAAFTGVVIASAINMGKQEKMEANFVWLLLLASALSSIFALAIASNDETIAKAAQYQDAELKPRLGRLAKREVLLWHQFKNAPATGRCNRALRILTFPFPHFLFVFSSAIPLVIVWMVKGRISFDLKIGICFALSMALCIVASAALLLSARKYNDVVKTAKKPKSPIDNTADTSSKRRNFNLRGKQKRRP